MRASSQTIVERWWRLTLMLAAIVLELTDMWPRMAAGKLDRSLFTDGFMFLFITVLAVIEYRRVKNVG
jgi:hypothetical protein